MTEQVAEIVKADPNMIAPRIQDPFWAASMACINAPDSLDPAMKSGRKEVLSPEEADIISLYCGACPVVSDCLTNALQRGIKTGVHGGLSQNQRAVLHEKYDMEGNGHLIPRKAWMLAISHAADLAKTHPTSNKTLRRSEVAREKILRFLERTADGSFTPSEDKAAKADKTIFQRIGNELHVSSVLVRQQIFALGREGVITAKAQTRGKAIHIASIALKQSEQAPAQTQEAA